MTPAQLPEVGDPFIVNGHFGCVTHVNAQRGLVLVRVFADPAIYGMHLPTCTVLVAAFDAVHNVPSAS
jgi:hypothetical protein